MSDEFTWLQYPPIAEEQGPDAGKAQFPAEAVSIWKARGWVECEPPAEVNIWRDDVAAPADAAPPETVVHLPVTEVPTDPIPKPARRPAGTTPAEEA